MQLQMTTDYALRILVHLASVKQVVSSKELAGALTIPHKYVLRVGNKLKAHGFVSAVTGVKGGYTIDRPLGEISIYDVMVAFEGTIKINRCLDSDAYCSRRTTASCVVHHFFRDAQAGLEEKIKAQTLATLLEYETNGSCKRM